MIIKEIIKFIFAFIVFLIYFNGVIIEFFPTGFHNIFPMKPILLLFAFVAFFLTSCSGDNDEIQGVELNSVEFLKSNELLEANFLPTFTSYYGRDRGTSTNRSSSLASEWIHEYEDNDKLVKSYFFELYPYRLLKEITYLEVGEGNTLEYELKDYSYYGLLYSMTDTLALTFDDNLIIKTIGYDKDVLIELDEKGRATRIHAVSGDGSIIYQIGYKFDEQGNILEYNGYDSFGVQTSSVVYTYNAQGDPLSYHFTNPEGVETIATYQYQGDHTLEKLEEEYFYDADDFGTEVYTYTPEERLDEIITNKGDGSKDVVTFTEDEVVVEYFDEEGLIYESYSYGIQEERHVMNWQKEFLNGVLQLIKYFDSNGDLEYTEYYNENGDLTETVYE